MEAGLLKSGQKYQDLLPSQANSTSGNVVVLSKELQLYHGKISESLFALEEGNKVRDAALESLGSDPGLQPLLPHLTLMITTKLTKSLSECEKIMTCLLTFKALFKNPNLFVDPYLHEWMPSLLTSVIGKNAGGKRERQQGAQLIQHAIKKYGHMYTAFSSRCMKTLCRGLIGAKSFAGRYGGVIGLGLLGNESIKSLILPNCALMGDYIEKNGSSDVEGAQLLKEGVMVSVLFFNAY